MEHKVRIDGYLVNIGAILLTITPILCHYCTFLCQNGTLTILVNHDRGRNPIETGPVGPYPLPRILGNFEPNQSLRRVDSNGNPDGRTPQVPDLATISEFWARKSCAAERTEREARMRAASGGQCQVCRGVAPGPNCQEVSGHDVRQDDRIHRSQNGSDRTHGGFRAALRRDAADFRLVVTILGRYKLSHG